MSTNREAKAEWEDGRVGDRRIKRLEQWVMSERINRLGPRMGSDLDDLLHVIIVALLFLLLRHGLRLRIG